MIKKEFRNDIIKLKRLYVRYLELETFVSSYEEMKAYNNYWTYLNELANKYGKTIKQIAGCINI